MSLENRVQGLIHSNQKEWYTPQWVFDGLPITFDLDPCSPESGPVTPARKHYTKRDNGLVQPWEGTVWMNPPYGTDVPAWLSKLKAHGDGIALVFARTGTAWFHENLPCAWFFLRGRIQFIPGFDLSKKTGSPAADSVFMAYGPKCAEALRRCSLRGTFVEAPAQQAQVAQAALWDAAAL